MTIEFLKEWRHFGPGNTTDAVPSGVAAELIRREIAREFGVVAVEKPEPHQQTKRPSKRA